MPATLPRYILVTPARNEGAFIEHTLKSVIAQRVLPVRWLIVNDGSTDDTAAVVLRYAAEHDWIELVNLPARTERDFVGKVHAVNAGVARAAGLD